MQLVQRASLSVVRNMIKHETSLLLKRMLEEVYKGRDL